MKRNNTYTMLDNKLKSILFLVFTYLIILVFRGFEYASNDVVDVMSYARYLQDSSLFSKDFYIQNIITSMPNERIVFSYILSNFGFLLVWLPFAMHFAFTLLFLLGLFKISNIYIKSKGMIWLMILVLLGPLYKFNLGGNELFYNMFIASYVAKVFGVWAVYYILKDKRTFSYLLLIISTLLHPTVGGQLFILFVLMELYYLIFEKRQFELNIKKIFPIFLYLFVAGYYLWLLLNAVNKSGVGNEKYFEIFEFRNAHHFFPQYFSIKNYIIEIAIYTIGLYSMFKWKYKRLLILSIIIILGIVVYVFGVLVFKIPLVLSTQWFKSTIWLELFSLIAITSYLSELLNQILRLKIDNIIFYGIGGISILLLVLSLSGVSYFKQKSYSFWSGLDLSEEEDIGLKVKSYSDKDAVFIYPMEFTGFKFYSERSAYIDFKSVVHRKDVLGEWYNRIERIYKIDITTRKSGEDLFKVAKSKYLEMDSEDIKYYKGLGINYLVQYSESSIALPIVVQNSRFKVYRIK